MKKKEILSILSVLFTPIGIGIIIWLISGLFHYFVKGLGFITFLMECCITYLILYIALLIIIAPFLLLFWLIGMKIKKK